MPGYILEADREEAGKSYVDFLRNPGPPREQGFLQTTKRISKTSLQKAMASTYGMISMIDDCVGRLLDQLRVQGLTEDTLIIFTSDHGELLGDHGLIRKGPSPYRALLQIPCVMAGPGVAPGMRNQMTSHLDLRATLSDYLGLQRQKTDGVSFAALMRDDMKAGRETLFAEYHPRTRMDTYNQTFLSDDWRLTIYPKNPDWGEMFDLQRDPGEHRNLFHDPSSRQKRAELEQRLQTEFAPAPEAGGPSLATY